MRAVLLVALMSTALCAVSCASSPDWRAELASWKAGAPWPDFPLVDDTGRAVSLHDVKPPVTVGFVYTRCPVESMCPTTMRDLVRAHRDGMRVLVVTLDPENDTPAALRAYRERFGVDGGDDGFTMVTGEREPLEALASLENVALVNGAHAQKVVELDERFVAHESSLEGQR